MILIAESDSLGDKSLGMEAMHYLGGVPPAVFGTPD
jgi:hypothetical protein